MIHLWPQNFYTTSVILILILSRYVWSVLDIPSCSLSFPTRKKLLSHFSIRHDVLVNRATQPSVPLLTRGKWMLYTKNTLCVCACVSSFIFISWSLFYFVRDSFFFAWIFIDIVINILIKNWGCLYVRVYVERCSLFCASVSMWHVFVAVNWKKKSWTKQLNVCACKNWFKIFERPFLCHCYMIVL